MDVIRELSSSHSVCAATIGSFDGVHRGHKFLIDRVKAVAQKEQCRSAVVTFSMPPQQVVNPLFKPQLINTYEEKIQELSQTGIDECFVLDFTKELSDYSAMRFMNDILREQFGVAHLVIGYDHRFGHNRSEGYNDYILYGKEMNMSVEAVPAFEWHDRIISSSVIRQSLLAGDVEAANDALGYSYYLNGIVGEGHQIGRQIGFPTANVMVNSPEKIIPKRGVYAVRVAIGSDSYNGMLNIGHRPTIGNGDDISIEVNIFDFDEDIYTRAIRLSFIKYIRPEQKFASIEALKFQLQKDRTEIESVLNK